MKRIRDEPDAIVRRDYFITGWLASFLRDAVVSRINSRLGRAPRTEGERLFEKS